jgi:hypothetical protein
MALIQAAVLIVGVAAGIGVLVLQVISHYYGEAEQPDFIRTLS